MKDTYFDHYLPLVKEFCLEVSGQNLDGLEKLSQPFFPLFGTQYEQSPLRIVMMGQDTMSWGNLKNFIEMEGKEAGSALKDDLEEFEDHDFLTWGSNKTRYSFLGFVLMFLASIHGIRDWCVLRRGEYKSILNSFAWANGNAIEYFDSSANGNGAAYATWEAVWKAGQRFNGVHHLLKTLNPHVIVVMWKNMQPEFFFEGVKYVQLDGIDGVRRYRIEEGNVEVFHIPHPGRMKFEDHTADYFCEQVTTAIIKQGLTIEYPTFVKSQDEAHSVVEYLRHHAPEGLSKYDFVEWVATELRKRDSVMSVPTLVNLVNNLGYSTDYETEYEGGRGSYRLISASYHRASNPSQAEAIAQAFVKPNGDYAYNDY